jgi:hypothetical protein
MPISVQWHETDARILHYKFVGQWTWKEYYAVLPRGRDMMRTTTAYVGIINDMMDSSYVPIDFLIQAKTVTDTRPVNTGLAIFVSDNYFFKSMYQVLERLHPDIAQHYWLSSDLEQAVKHVQAWLDDHSSSPTSE